MSMKIFSSSSVFTKKTMLPLAAIFLVAAASTCSAQTSPTGTTTSSGAVALVPMPRATGTQSTTFYLGQHMLYTATYPGLSKDMFSGVRIWGAEGTTWAQIEPTPGNFDFSKFDKHVAGAKNFGFEIMHTLGQTPQWASSRPTELGNSGLGAAAEPANMDHWRRYVGEVARRYRWKIAAYEVMNEPRIPEAYKIWSPGFFSGTSAKLATMTQIAYEEVKKADPSAKIVCPSMDGDEYGINRLDKFLATGAGKYCDVIGFHYYLRTLTIAELRTLIGKTKAVMAKYGLQNRPIWDTESGVLIAEAGYNLVPKETTGAFSKMFGSGEASRFAAQFLVVSQMLGVQRTYWFAHDTSWMGSTVADKRRNVLNPFGKSLTLINSWLGGKSFGGCVDKITSVECRVYQKNWIGNIYWGDGRTAAEWRKLGFKSVQFLNGEIVDLATADPTKRFPSIVDDVIFIFRP